MNRTDRLLAIVLELQGRERVTAEALAHTFGVTKRTIYRDILALNESGVPVVSAAGQGYWLMEGYFLPPVSLSPDEAMMLTLGSEVMAQSFDTQYRAAAKSASRKIEAVLSGAVAKDVAYLKDNIRFVQMDSDVLIDTSETLQLVRKAILEQHPLHLRYFKRLDRTAGELSERTVDPHALIHFKDAWVLSAYCHLRRAMRTFRLDRIQEVSVLPQMFERQVGYSVNVHDEPNPSGQEVALLFDKGVTQWVKERPVYFVHDTCETPEGLRVTLKVHRLEEALSWILSWGSSVRVLAPKSLKDLLKLELEVTLRAMSSEQSPFGDER